MKRKINFSVARLLVDEQNFDLSHFPLNSFESDHPFEDPDGIQHSRKTTYQIDSNQFAFIYVEEGSGTPCPTNVYNFKNSKDEKNPRKLHQIERRDQIFVFIQEATQKIFISDYRKKKFLEGWLTKQLGKNALIKSIIDREKFVNKIEQINSLHFSAVPRTTADMFAMPNILNEMLKSDEFNYGTDVKNMKLTVEFLEGKVTDRIREKIKNLLSPESCVGFDKLIVTGRFDNKLEAVFNTNEILEKVEIEVDCGENKLFNPKDVLDCLLGK